MFVASIIVLIYNFIACKFKHYFPNYQEKGGNLSIPTLMCMNLYLLSNQQLAVAPGVEVGVLISEYNAKQKSFIFQ